MTLVKENLIGYFQNVSCILIKIIDRTGIYNNFSGYKPKIGDIIQAKYNGYYYEIVDVNHTEQMFLQFKHCWDLIVKPMKIEHLSSNV